MVAPHGAGAPASGCPFGHGAAAGADAAPPPAPPPVALEVDATSGAAAAGRRLARVPTGKARVQLLYEAYVHLPPLAAVWASPVTEGAVLEPLFAAAAHGLELGFTLLAEFLGDTRAYVAKRPRVERVARDVAAQCALLAAVVDGELEEEPEEAAGLAAAAAAGDAAAASAAPPAARRSLTQEFPFPGCPPTTREPRHSPGLARLAAAVRAAAAAATPAEGAALVKVVANLTAAFSAFDRWTVGLGVEHQLDALRAAVGLPPMYSRAALLRRRCLDYNALVRPEVVEATLTGEAYEHAEDFFFRSVHLGTDCWAHVALARLGAAAAAARARAWHAAAARAGQAAAVLSYLGDHVLLLTSMNLRDYLDLKVELEGTSGEGSARVRALRPAVAALLAPVAAALGLPAAAAAGGGEGADGAGAAAELGARLMAVYEAPAAAPGLYNYCKALEDLESALTGGFYFKHFCLAQNVIGSDARGTMRRAVAALKGSYERPVFPVLDRVRSALGAKVDAQRAGVKGRIMESILEAHLRGGDGGDAPPGAAGAAGGGCPFGFGGGGGGGAAAAPAAAAPTRAPPAAAAAAPAAAPPAADEEDAAVRRLYSWDGVPLAFRLEVAARVRGAAARLGVPPPPARAAAARDPSAAPLAFLDHAWGAAPPRALRAAALDGCGLHRLGNPSWDAVFGEVAPAAAAAVRAVLGLRPGDAAATVQFGSNSHELVLRLLSAAAAPGPGAGPRRPLRVLCSDTEFYSFARQANRAAEAGLLAATAVPAEPAATFAARAAAAVRAAAAAGAPYDAVYASQVAFLTQATLLPDVPGFAAAVAEAAGAEHPPLLIVDAYHGFCAVPTDLSAALGGSSDGADAGAHAARQQRRYGRLVYVAGMLKHAGAGANAAFAVLSGRLAAALRPVSTGWLADPSVLAPGAGGVRLGDAAAFPAADCALQGGTPAYVQPLLLFNRVVAMWREERLCGGDDDLAAAVGRLHAHVMRLHRRLLAGLPASGAFTAATLVPPAPEPVRSHTLVFAQPDAAAAAAAVAALRSRGVLVDCRGRYARVGVGANHCEDDVDALLAAIAAAAAEAGGGE